MNLTFREKNAIAKQLANDSFIDKDKELLRKHFPQDKLLHRSPSVTRPDLSFDILFVLLDFETSDSIIANRNMKIIAQKNMGQIAQIARVKEHLKEAPVKKKLPKKKNIQKSNGQILKTKTSEMLTQYIQIGSTAIAGCARLIKSLK